MKRPCFLCGSEIEVLDRAAWSLPNLAPMELGFGSCRGCGLVLQAPIAAPEVMQDWYRDHAIYTSPGRSGQPHPRKVRGTTRLLNAVEHALGHPAKTVFQIGCSDGYALSRFRSSGSCSVRGLDPSPASAALARNRYGVEVQVGAIESLLQFPASELWVLTHVLEHLHDPLEVLRRAHAAGTSRPAWLVIEVPLFERPSDLPPGYLSFEHLNYFNEDSLLRMMALAGYDVVSLDKQYEDDIYPVVALVARASERREALILPGERERARACLKSYLKRERNAWSDIENRLRDQIAAPNRLFLWGGGVYASQLLANTDVGAFSGLTGILDSSEQRWGSRLGDHHVLDPSLIDLAEGDCVVISSFASELEIWNSLAPERERGVQVVRLHQ